MSAVSPVPLVLCVDVEPDARSFKPDAPSPWDGLPRSLDLLEEFRGAVASATGRPAHVSWFLRMDPQVERGYGRMAWVVDGHPEIFDRLCAAGDHFGLHVHVPRWDAAAGDWVIDYADAGWVDDCIARAFEAFRQSVGVPATTFRFGDHWMDQRTFAQIEALGVEVDLTLEPGHDETDFYGRFERHTGGPPDFRAVPTHPYRPSLADYRVPDPDRCDGPWVLPVTTARVRPRLLHRLYRHLVSRRTWGETSTALVSQHPSLFSQIVDAALARPNPHLVLTLRSSAAVKPAYAARVRANLSSLLRRPEGRQLAWVDPATAVRWLAGREEQATSG